MMADDDQLLLLEEDNVGGGVDNIFVYTGADQEVPRDVKRVRIAENVDTIAERVFAECEQLIEVEGHNKLKKIEKRAFYKCVRLQRITKMNGVKEIKREAFYRCDALSDLDFDKLESMGHCAFGYCRSLRSINLLSVRRVEESAFVHCTALTDAVFGSKDLGRIDEFAFNWCTALRRIAIPLNYSLVVENSAVDRCANLSRVDAVGAGMHETISSLHLESWRDEMMEKIDQINQTLPETPREEKASAINRWIRSVLNRMEHYKSEHQILLKEAMTLLELAIWKTKLLNEAGEKKCSADVTKKKVKIDAEAARKEHRVTCGASIVIKNVLPFLALQKDG